MLTIAVGNLFPLLAVEPASGRDAGDGYPVVFAIKVVGNRTTALPFILREMELRPGMSATPDILESDRLRLLSLGIFNQVEISMVSDRGRAVVLVRVTERFYIYPYPIIRYDPADPSRRVFGLTINHDNFRGRAEQLSVGWWDGYERGASLIHRDPWFSLWGLYGLQTRLFVNDLELQDPVGVAHRARIESVSGRLRRRLDRHRWIGFETEWEERSSKGAFYTLNAGGRDRLAVCRLFYESDLRDYIYYPRSGYYFAASLRGNWMVDTTHSFFRQQADLRFYRSRGRLTLALRGVGQLSQRKLPYYRYVELSQLDVRSDDPVGRRGSRGAAVNLEARFNILPIRYYSFEGVPLAGQYLQKLKFSVEGLLFADQGYLRRFDTNRDFAMSAYGCGLQFQLPYIEVAHFTLGWGPSNPLQKPAIVLASGVTF